MSIPPNNNLINNDNLNLNIVKPVDVSILSPDILGRRLSISRSESSISTTQDNAEEVAKLVLLDQSESKNNSEIVENNLQLNDEALPINAGKVVRAGSILQSDTVTEEAAFEHLPLGKWTEEEEKRWTEEAESKYGTIEREIDVKENLDNRVEFIAKFEEKLGKIAESGIKLNDSLQSRDEIEIENAKKAIQLGLKNIIYSKNEELMPAERVAEKLYHLIEKKLTSPVLASIIARKVMEQVKQVLDELAIISKEAKGKKSSEQLRNQEFLNNVEKGINRIITFKNELKKENEIQSFQNERLFPLSLLGERLGRQAKKHQKFPDKLDSFSSPITYSMKEMIIACQTDGLTNIETISRLIESIRTGIDKSGFSDNTISNSSFAAIIFNRILDDCITDTKDVNDKSVFELMQLSSRCRIEGIKYSEWKSLVNTYFNSLDVTILKEIIQFEDSTFESNLKSLGLDRDQDESKIRNFALQQFLNIVATKSSQISKTLLLEMINDRKRAYDISIQQSLQALVPNNSEQQMIKKSLNDLVEKYNNFDNRSYELKNQAKKARDGYVGITKEPVFANIDSENLGCIDDQFKDKYGNLRNPEEIFAFLDQKIASLQCIEQFYESELTRYEEIGNLEALNKLFKGDKKDFKDPKEELTIINEKLFSSIEKLAFYEAQKLNLIQVVISNSVTDVEIDKRELIDLSAACTSKLNELSKMQTLLTKFKILNKEKNKNLLEEITRENELDELRKSILETFNKIEITENKKITKLENQINDKKVELEVYTDLLEKLKNKVDLKNEMKRSLDILKKDLTEVQKLHRLPTITNEIKVRIEELFSKYKVHDMRSFYRVIVSEFDKLNIMDSILQKIEAERFIYDKTLIYFKDKIVRLRFDIKRLNSDKTNLEVEQISKKHMGKINGLLSKQLIEEKITIKTINQFASDNPNEVFLKLCKQKFINKVIVQVDKNRTRELAIDQITDKIVTKDELMNLILLGKTQGLSPFDVAIAIQDAVEDGLNQAEYSHGQFSNNVEAAKILENILKSLTNPPSFINVDIGDKDFIGEVRLNNFGNTWNAYEQWIELIKNDIQSKNGVDEDQRILKAENFAFKVIKDSRALQKASKTTIVGMLDSLINQLNLLSELSENDKSDKLENRIKDLKGKIDDLFNMMDGYVELPFLDREEYKEYVVKFAKKEILESSNITLKTIFYDIDKIIDFSENNYQNDVILLYFMKRLCLDTDKIEAHRGTSSKYLKLQSGIADSARFSEILKNNINLQKRKILLFQKITSLGYEVGGEGQFLKKNQIEIDENEKALKKEIENYESYFRLDVSELIKNRELLENKLFVLETKLKESFDDVNLSKKLKIEINSLNNEIKNLNDRIANFPIKFDKDLRTQTKDNIKALKLEHKKLLEKRRRVEQDILNRIVEKDLIAENTLNLLMTSYDFIKKPAYFRERDGLEKLEKDRLNLLNDEENLKNNKEEIDSMNERISRYRQELAEMEKDPDIKLRRFLAGEKVAMPTFTVNSNNKITFT